MNTFQIGNQYIRYKQWWKNEDIGYFDVHKRYGYIDYRLCNGYLNFFKL